MHGFSNPFLSRAAFIRSATQRRGATIALAAACMLAGGLFAASEASAQDGGARDAAAEGRDSSPREPQDVGRSRRMGRNGMPLPPDWPRAGGYGPAGSDRPMIENLVVEGLLPSSFGRRELTDEDLLRVVEVAREVSPQWGDAIEARRAEDPGQLRSSLRASGRRLLGLVALKERAPRVFAAKIAELRAQAETERVAGELRRAESERRESDVADAALDRRIEELGARLEQAAAAQVQATLAARGAELVALDERLAALKKELASDESGSDRLADEIVERAREGRPDRREPRQGDR